MDRPAGGERAAQRLIVVGRARRPEIGQRHRVGRLAGPVSTERAGERRGADEQAGDQPVAAADLPSLAAVSHVIAAISTLPRLQPGAPRQRLALAPRRRGQRMVRMAGEEQVIGGERARPPRDRQLLADGDVAVAGRGSSVERRGRCSFIAASAAAPRRPARGRRAGRRQGGGAWHHPQKLKSVAASVVTLVTMISMSAMPLPSSVGEDMGAAAGHVVAHLPGDIV